MYPPPVALPPNGSDRRLRERREAYDDKARAATVPSGMRECLGPVARRAREAARARLEQVSVAIKGYRSAAALSRFERRESWPEDVDRVLEGYAEVTHTDPRALWKCSLEYWYEEEARAKPWLGPERRHEERRHDCP